MIKKTLIVVSILASMHSFAQLNKNRIMINGRGNFYTDKRVEDMNLNMVPLQNIEKVSEGNANLNVGYFLSNNFAIGGLFGFGKNTNTSTYEYISGDREIQKNTTQSFSTGIFARYNHMIKESKFGLFFQLNNTYGWGKSEGKATHFPPNGLPPFVSLTQGKSKLFNIGLTPGLMYFITNRLSIETSIGDLSYYSNVIKDQPQELDIRKNSGFNADFSMATVYFGLTFYLGGSKIESEKSAASESK